MIMQAQFANIISRGSKSGREGIRTGIFLYVLLLLAVSILIAPAMASAYVSVSVTLAPPPLPVYAQPPCPAPGFIWVPGYWAWDPAFGYYWVPGLWTPAPFIGALWTPGYWAWDDGVYLWNDGYWGPIVGFYGGINYGFGYTGYGYYGGYWSAGTYYYNSTVNNVNVTNITNVYTKSVSNVRPSGASFNGGHGGTTARPTPQQMNADHQHHFSPTPEQRRQAQTARTNPGQRAAENHGLPLVAATRKPGAFSGHGVVSAVRSGTPFKAASTSYGKTVIREPVQDWKRSAPVRHSPRPEYAAPGYAVPRYAMRQPEHKTHQNPWQQPTPGASSYNKPRFESQKPRPTGPWTRRENPAGEGREFR